MKSIGLYIHIPYCIHKCGYCDFNSHPINNLEMDHYVDALFHEIAFYSKPTQDRKIASIFVGGGTPTTLPTHHLKNILNRCRDAFILEPKLEVTLEVNPATIKTDTFMILREAGYNRISVGVQSFHHHELKKLERIHSTKEIFLTINRAREAGVDNLSLDLMFSLPGQTCEQWTYSLNQAISLNPEHLSTYNLTIEPETAFYNYFRKGRLKLPDDDHQLFLFKNAIQKLSSSGYKHYEISNFTKPGKECRHNINYWKNGEYLGLGAGASSYFKGFRFKNINRPSDYILKVSTNGSAIAHQEQPDLKTEMGEALMLGLRLRDGILIEDFEKRFQISFEKTYQTVLNSLLKKNLIKLNRGRLVLTEKGFFLTDSVILEFLPDPVLFSN